MGGGHAASSRALSTLHRAEVESSKAEGGQLGEQHG
jgi:hypothetical protein